MSTYRLARQADDDLEKIADYLADQSPRSATGVLEALFDTFTLLASFPLIGPLREDLGPSLRVFPGRGSAHNYLIFYYPTDEGIEVSTIIYGTRDYLQIFERRQ